MPADLKKVKSREALGLDFEDKPVFQFAIILPVFSCTYQQFLQYLEHHVSTTLPPPPPPQCFLTICLTLPQFLHYTCTFLSMYLYMYMYMYVAIVINNTKLIASTASTVWMNEKSIRDINSLVYTIKWLYVCVG